MKFTKMDAVINLVGGGISAVNDEISYMDGQTPPSDAEIDAELKRLQAEHDGLAWSRSRQEAYPNLQDCIHALLDGGDTLTDLQAKRKAVKSKYPKE